MSDLTFESPVVNKPTSNPSAALTLADVTATAKIVVTGDGASDMGVEFGTSRRDAAVLVTGSRPGEVTMIGPLTSAQSMMDSAPTPGLTTVIDWTHRSAQFRLTGADATRALNKLCGLDFGDHMIPNGAVFSGSVAGVGCDFVREDSDGTPSYWMACDRSFGQYLFDTLLDAGDEFGIGTV